MVVITDHLSPIIDFETILELRAVWVRSLSLMNIESSSIKLGR